MFVDKFKDIKVWFSQGLKRCKFPDVLRIDRQTENGLLSCMRTET